MNSLVASAGCWVLIMAAVLHAQITVPSPDRTVQAEISRGADGRLAYAVRFGPQPVLAPSPIGVVVNGIDLGKNVQFGDPAESSTAIVEFPWRGNHAQVQAPRTSQRISLATGQLKWTLEVQSWDFGVAYRCIIPGEGDRRVTGEAAAWNLPAGTYAWCNPDTKNCEGIHQRHPVEQIPAERFKNGISMPTVLELPNGKLAVITEADVMGYSGMTLEPTGSHQLKCSFRDDPDGWSMRGTITTPWRVVMLANDLNELVHNDLVPALCPPPDKKLFPEGIRTDWLKPGRCLWQWWAYDDAGTHWSKQKDFVDRAAELNCQYYLVDEGWEHTRQQWAGDRHDVWSRMKELCDYAAGKNVGIWVWRGWRYDEDRQWPGLETQAKRDEFFRRCREVGIKGVKIDFMDSESHEMLAFYEACLRTAAQHQVMVNFHGANKPAGEARTWPNEMNREGIRGLEYNKWSTLPASHYATLPFTRMIAGHADFTPTTFQAKMLKGTTFAQQLACSVVLTGPFLCWADKPELYLQSPAVEFIRSLPVVWDETRVLPGSKIGELASFARRSGTEWYVGILNGGKACEIELDFAFLGQGEYQADFYGDVSGQAAELDVRKNVKVTPSTKQTIHLNDGGGFGARIRP